MYVSHIRNFIDCARLSKFGKTRSHLRVDISLSKAKKKKKPETRQVSKIKDRPLKKKHSQKIKKVPRRRKSKFEDERMPIPGGCLAL